MPPRRTPSPAYYDAVPAAIVALALALAAAVTVWLLIVTSPDHSPPTSTVPRASAVISSAAEAGASFTADQDPPGPAEAGDGGTPAVESADAPAEGSALVAPSAGPPIIAAVHSPKPAPEPRRWRPADECARLLRPVSAATMRWCPYVAEALYRTGKWEPGDLTRLLRIIDCESGGNPSAVNPSSRATGLFQHLPRYWGQRGAKAAAVFGFDHPTITAPFDNILVGVWLYTSEGARHWPNCGRR